MPLVLRCSFLLLACLYVSNATQALSNDVTLNGVVNVYTPVMRFDHRCSTAITVDNISGFAVGDRIVVMQMQGADVDRSTTASHGRVVNMDAAGMFEFATIASIDAANRTLHVQERLRNPYDVAHRVQVIRVAVATNATISGTVRAQPWNGRIGGVIVLEVAIEVRLNGSIDVRDCGFQGGALWNGGTTCSVMDMNGAANAQRVAAKGQGIAQTVAGFEAGRGCWANGGGGGAAHNSGGGGGGNGGAGGKGGNQWINCGATADNGGFGGVAIPFDPNQPRLVMGGGGGAGQQNDRVGTAGVRGGGIVIVKCASLTGSGQILASGSSVTAVAQNDGAGGGGAAGSVWIDAQSADERIRVHLRGGDGGSTRTGAAHGPGGGGGGGVFITSWPMAGTDLGVDLNGGAHGENLSVSGSNRVYYAQSGQAGVRFAGLPLPRSLPPVLPTIVAPPDTIVCSGATVSMVARATSSTRNPTILWMDSAGRQLSAQPSLRIAVLQSGRYICSVTDENGCSAFDTTHITVLHPPRLAVTDLHLGTLTICRPLADTVLWLYNKGVTVATVGGVRVESGASMRDTLRNVQIPPGDSLRIPIVMGREATSPIRVTVTAGPCDTTLVATVRWQQHGFAASIAPTRIVEGPFLPCKTVVVRRDISIGVTGDTATIVGYLEEGIASWVTKPMLRIIPGELRSLAVLVVAHQHDRLGRIAAILQSGDCIDTVWCTIEATFHPPIFASDTIDLGVIDRCALPANYTVEIPSFARETLTVSNVTSSSRSLAIVRYDPTVAAGGVLSVTVRYAGGTDTTAVLSIGFAECDSILYVTVRWSYQGSLFSIDPTIIDVGDAIVCAERTIDTSITIRSIAGSGTILEAIVQGASVDVDVSQSAIADGGQRECRLSWTLPLGQARARVGFVVTSGRCLDTLWVDLTGSTRRPALRVPERLRVVGGTVGATDGRSILIENPSNVDITITSIGLPDAPFSLDTVGLNLPRTIAAGESISVPVEFLRRCGVFVDSIVVRSTIPCRLEGHTILEMEVSTTTTIELVSVEAQAGEMVEIPVVITGRPDALPELTQAFTVTLQMPRSLAAPMPQHTPGVTGVRYDGGHAYVTSSLVWQGTDTITRIPVLALLAAASSEVVTIAENGFVWSGLECQVEHSPATIVAGPPCAGRERRLVRLGGSIVEVRVSPIPAAEWLDVTIDATDNEFYVVALVDVTGRTVARTLATSNQATQIGISGVPSGVHMLHIQGRFQTAVIPTIIAR